MAFLARHFHLPPHEVLKWRESERRLWINIVGEQYADERQVDRVEQARATSTAVLQPKKLKELLPKRIRESMKAAGSRAGKAASSSVSPREAIKKAERIRRMKGSGSVVEGESMPGD